MGADIHYFAEKRTEDGWEYLPGSFYFGGERNYSLFSILAGVRRRAGDPEQIAPVRGMPADLSAGGLQLIADMGHDSFDEFVQDDLAHHSHSWVLLKELIDYPWHRIKHDPTVPYIAAAEQAREYILTNTIPRLREYAEPEDIRVVFWFDA